MAHRLLLSALHAAIERDPALTRTARLRAEEPQRAAAGAGARLRDALHGVLELVVELLPVRAPALFQPQWHCQSARPARVVGLFAWLRHTNGMVANGATRSPRAVKECEEVEYAKKA